MASDQMPAGTPGFLRLPPELRNTIYGFCNSMNGIAGPTRSPHPPVSNESDALLRDIYGTIAPSPKKFQFNALVQTCRTLRQDAFAFFLADVALVLDVVPDSFEATRKGLNKIPAHVLSKIKTMFIIGNIGCNRCYVLDSHFLSFTMRVKFDVQNGCAVTRDLAMVKSMNDLARASTRRRCNQAVGCAYDGRLPGADARLQALHHMRTTEILTEAQQKIALERLIEVIDGRAEEAEHLRKKMTVFGLATSSFLLACTFYHTGGLAGDSASMVVLLATIALLWNGMSAAEVLWKEESPPHREGATVLAIGSAVLLCGAYHGGDVAGDITFMAAFLAIIAVVSRYPSQRSDVQCEVP
ncbi:hypothetical protein LTR56_012283 [Elasticomyces elasticus]|nr:hypothetical protein LTR22_021048 [Elasticomyces elasticus]KAK3639706.1 hypothetical protein LTR56_012283 [Elasticomyces elasticus]KAK4922568.1 hypothetical protein LTR49_010095 [Elasticomyces elasticus]KAK5760741.1 hypothetical protein LTS12_009099 [Elasticomyces elasticus]